MQGDTRHIGVHGERVDGGREFVHVSGAHHLLKRGQSFADHAVDRHDADTVSRDVRLGGHAEQLRQHIGKAELLSQDSVVLGLSRVDEEGLAA